MQVAGDDPLVTPAYAGIGGWFQRIGGVFRRSWKSLLAVFVITTALPAVAIGAATVALTAFVLMPWQKEILRASAAQESPRFDVDPAVVFEVIGATILVIIVLVILQAAGYAAATYVATREAAGLPVPLGEALGYGLRRCLGLAGWNLVTGLLIALGTLACVLPGIYVAAATALVGPIYMFERRRPVARSFDVFHKNLGRVLGRLALAVVIVYGGSFVVGMLESVANAVLGSTDPSVALPAAMGVSVVGSLLGLPFTMFMFVAVLLTYTEQRGYEAPTDAGILAANL
jgi:hypothetical protein